MEAERERRVSLQLACDKALVEERQARQRQASAALEAELARGDGKGAREGLERCLPSQ